VNAPASERTFVMPAIKKFRRALTQPTVAVGLLAAVYLAPTTPDAIELTSSSSAGSAPAYSVAPRPELERIKSVAEPIRLERRPEWVLPLPGFELTGRFGSSNGPWASTHTGLDFAAPSGTPIRSVADGVVVGAGYDGAFGNKTVVRLEDGTHVWYCHQDRLSVSVGESLSAGEVLGYVGTTGNTTGAHLHLEMHPVGGTPVDPEATLAEHGLF
jgi:murein DD-endopeptidase MepM/ murein hydrolase activator NlpD